MFVQKLKTTFDPKLAFVIAVSNSPNVTLQFAADPSRTTANVIATVLSKPEATNFFESAGNLFSVVSEVQVEHFDKVVEFDHSKVFSVGSVKLEEKVVWGVGGLIVGSLLGG